MKYIIIAIVALILIFGINMNIDKDYSKATINGNEISLEVISSIEDQIRGLSNRDSLDYDTGMLFLYKDSKTRSFWMKEMRFSVDILWIDENNIIVGIEKNVSPDSYPKKFISPKPVPFALELAGGWGMEHGLKIGDLVEFD